MPHKRWVSRGHFLDLEDIDVNRRPDGRATRFWRVKEQRLTNVRPIKAGSQISGGEEVEFGIDTTNNTGVLALDDAGMVMQCAFGLKNDFKAWMEHPTDYSMRQVDDEVPGLAEEIGQITMDDSGYWEPNLDETEFWVIKDIADTPSIHAKRESGLAIEPTISVKANKLVLEPVTASETVKRLREFGLPSTPVNLQVTV